ncbi:MAG: response regulator [Clostridiales bacterium]|nr:response regulator [Clostridiales bacterium]
MSSAKARDIILIVDDIETNRAILEEILKDKYETVSAENGMVAMSLMLSGSVRPSIVLLDIMMPEMDGYEVLEMMKNNVLTERVPVVFITAADAESNETKGLGRGAVDYISKPFNPEIVLARVATHLRLHHYSERLELMVQEKVEELVRSKEKMLETMANIIECRNLESGNHVKRTKELMRILAECLNENPSMERCITEAEVDIMAKSAPLHDIGKISISDTVLLKPGRLTMEEFEVMKTHTTLGGAMIKLMIFDNEGGDEADDKYLECCYDIAMFHHERWDGKGYPSGISGEDIPLPARLLSLVDVYDALVSERVYKSAIPHSKAVTIIRDGAGTQFDGKVVDAFLHVEDRFKEYAEFHK